MSVPFTIEDGDGSGMEVSVRRRNGERGLVTFTEELRDRDVLFLPAFNDTFGVQMAQNFGFSGVAEEVHDGIDNTFWTATTVTGTKYTFDSADEANTGSASIKTNRAALSDVMQLDKGSDLDLSTFAAITMFVFVASGWSPLSADSITIYGWDTASGLQIGDSVRLEDYFNETTFNVWQTITIPFEDMNIQSATIDALRLEVSAKSGSGPVFYLDDIQIEKESASESFSVTAPQGKKYFVQSISFSFVDAFTATLADNSVPALSYDKILNLASLTNGITFQRKRKGVILFSATVRNVGDSIKGGATLKNEISDGVNACITLETDFLTPALLDSREDDSIDIILSDNLSTLISFTALFKGYTVEIGSAGVPNDA